MSQRIRTNQIAVSGVAQPLSATPVECKSFLLKNPKTNAANIYFGDSTVTTTTGYPLVPGEEFEFEYVAKNGEPVYDAQPQDIYVVGTASDRAAWVSAGR